MTRCTATDPAARRILAGIARDIRREYPDPFAVVASAAAELREHGIRYSVIAENCATIATRAVASVNRKRTRLYASIRIA